VSNDRHEVNVLTMYLKACRTEDGKESFKLYVSGDSNNGMMWASEISYKAAEAMVAAREVWEAE
jgi:hypothetical protein